MKSVRVALINGEMGQLANHQTQAHLIARALEIGLGHSRAWEAESSFNIPHGSRRLFFEAARLYICHADSIVTWQSSWGCIGAYQIFLESQRVSMYYKEGFQGAMRNQQWCLKLM